MYSYLKATCSKCGKEYFGKFAIDLDGSLSCIDCDNPVIWDDTLTYRLANSGKDASDKYLDMLWKDLEYLYPLYATKDEDVVSRFYDGENIDAKKVYFMGNPLEAADLGHRATYDSLKYLDNTVDNEYNELAEELIRQYMDLRETHFSAERLDLYRKQLDGQGMKNIRRINSYD